MELGHNIDTVYLDFSKAFDKVDHTILLQKIRNVGVCGNMGNWVGTFLSNRTQSVKVEYCVSENIEIVSGVPQGYVLGPILFLIYISNIGFKANSKSFI